MTTDAGVPGAPRFDVVLRGYDRRQVDEHVDRLQRVLARMRADLEVARSQPMPAVSPSQPVRPRPTPRPRPGGPAGSPDTIGNFTDRMETILQSAEEEAAEIRRNAHLAARAETDGIRSQVADLVRQRDSVLAELTRMRSQLEGLLAAPTAQMPAREPGRTGGGRHEDGPYGRPDTGPQPGLRGPSGDRYAAAPSTGPSPVGPGPSGAQQPGGPGSPAPAGPKAGPTGSSPAVAGAAPQGSSPGPSAHGPSTQGPSAKSPSGQSPSAQGPSAQGSSAQGPTTQGPTTQGPTTQGPTTQGPTTQGPTTQGPSTQGSSSQNPSSPAAPPKPVSGGAPAGTSEAGSSSAASQPGASPVSQSSSSSARSAPPVSNSGASAAGPSRAAVPSTPAPQTGSDRAPAASGARPSGPPPAPVGSTTILPTGVTPPDRRNAGSGASAAGPSSGNGAPPTSGSGPSVPKDAPSGRPEREAGKAAHRLPTGAYPAVAENSSMRPRREPDPEPADLFRPVARGGSPDPQTAAVPRGGVESAADRTSVVRRDDLPERPVTPPPAESTTKVGSVRPGEPTVLSPQPGPARTDQGDGRNGSSRPTSPSRSA